MSPTRFKKKNQVTLLAVLLICGCAPDASGPHESGRKVSQAATGKSCCNGCEATRACTPPAAVKSECTPPAPLPFQYSCVREAADGTPVVYTYTPTHVPTVHLPPAPVAEGVVSNTRVQRRPIGTWVRELGSCRIVLRFEEERLQGVCTFKDKKEAFTLTMDADYNITKDNVLYGVITGSEAAGRDDAQEAVVYVDMPFSARVRQDGDLLTVKGVKFLDRGVKTDDPKDLIVIEGRYKRQPKMPPGTAF